MHPKLPIISWHNEDLAWEERAAQARRNTPLKKLSSLPKMIGITAATARFLRTKGLFYLLSKDHHHIFARYIRKHPWLYLCRFLRTFFRKHPFQRKGDLFFYDLSDEEAWVAHATQKDVLCVLGFSYCHKPFECPSGRFSPHCQNDKHHAVCKQCFIGKASHLASLFTSVHITYIPTIHAIGETLLALRTQYPKRPIAFLITACELSLSMFSDFGHMIDAKGIGIRLDGRICNTMKAFHLSEQGIKPGLTIVCDETQTTILSLLSRLHTSACDEKA